VEGHYYLGINHEGATEMSTTRKLYQVREYVGSCYSKQLGCKLRDKPAANRIAKALKKAGRTVFIAPVTIRK